MSVFLLLNSFHPGPKLLYKMSVSNFSRLSSAVYCTKLVLALRLLDWL